MDFKYELIKTNDDLPFRMFIFEGKDGNYKVPKHWHRSIEIFVVLEGVIDFYINAVQYRLQRGQLILVNSNEIHAIDATYKNLTLVLQIPRQLFLTEASLGDVVFKHNVYHYDQEVIVLIKQMYASYEQKEKGYRLDVLSYFYKILYLLDAYYERVHIDESIRERNRQLEKLSIITEYIKDHYKEDISLESLAKEFGFTPPYLSRMFQKYAGINYKTYLMDVRTQNAYRELMNTDHSIMEVALNNGFSDSRSFSGAFRKRFDKLPSEYRKR